MIGAPSAPSPELRKRGPKPRIEHGSEGGPVMGSSDDPIPRLRTKRQPAAAEA